MSDLILHHYDGSPFAEKVRTMMGMKGLAWHSVDIPMIMPKPDLMPLTGGYRKTPVLQIGADIYCDTRLIADVLEAHKPDPSFYATGGIGLNKAIETWADEHMFWPAVGYMLGSFADKLPMAFHEDRAAMRGAKPNVEAAVKAVPATMEKLQAYLALLEDMLADGRGYLLGTTPALADLASYHCVWSIGRAGKTRVALEPFPKTDAWLARMMEIGHGDKTDLDSKAALEVAAKATPVDISPIEAAAGPALGSQVMVGTEDRIPEPVAGELVISTGSEIAVRRQTDDLGELVVHFPRLGYYIKGV